MRRVRRLLHAVLPPFALALLRDGAARLRHRLHDRKVIRRSYAGFPLELEIGDENAATWYGEDWPEPEELRVLRTHALRPGARVYDLGAHQAVVALVMARLVGDDGAVVALEASPYDAEVAERNRVRNSAQNLLVLNAAVAAESGRIEFGLDGRVGSRGSGWPTSAVRAFAVDDLATQYGDPDVVFIDVEGYEAEALKGATSVLAKRPDVFVEVHGEEALARFGSTPPEVVSFFPDDAFELLAATPNGDPFSPLDRGAAPRERFFLLALGRR